MSAHPESAIGRIAGSTERRDRTTTVAIVAAAQNGTSGVLAHCKHARRWATFPPPRTGVRGKAQPAPASSPIGGSTTIEADARQTLRISGRRDEGKRLVAPNVVPGSELPGLAVDCETREASEEAF